MFTRADIQPLSIAAALGVAGGIAFGAWAAPPRELADPLHKAEPQEILAEDPNLAAYKRMIAEQGGPGPLYIAAGYAPRQAADLPPVRDEAALIDAQIAREAAAFDAQARRWEAERVAWLDKLREGLETRPLAMAYTESPETATVVGARSATDLSDGADRPPPE
jgi:hypothetical protein